MYNELKRRTVTFEAREQTADILDKINTSLQDWNSVYSYSLYKQDIGYRLEVCCSIIVHYNVHSVATIVERIEQVLNTPSQEQLVSYLQPPLDIVLRTHEPLVRLLAKQQHARWNKLEREDLEQMARMVICILYNSGYLIHKRLIIKAYNNYVLQQLRKERNKPTLVSLDAPIAVKGQNLSIKDTVRDEEYEAWLQDEEDREANIQLMEHYRNRVKAHLGERQYRQLIHEYSNKSTTDWSRKTLYNLKKFFQRGKHT